MGWGYYTTTTPKHRYQFLTPLCYLPEVKPQQSEYRNVSSSFIASNGKNFSRISTPPNAPGPLNVPASADSNARMHEVVISLFH